MRRIRVGVLFGGRSGEHEVSLASAASVLRALDPERYEAVPIGITREGHWLMGGDPALMLQGEVTLEIPETTEAIPDVTHHSIVPVSERGLGLHTSAVDVVFPVLHGPYGEDGTVQGLLRSANIPFIGSGVLGSAVSMDKTMMKAIFEQAGLPSVPYLSILASRWQRDPVAVLEQIEGELAYPVFVKPCNLGSSVGISKARGREELAGSLEIAARYDRRLIVEQGLDVREVECGVLGNDEPMVSVPGEIVPHHEFYDYEAKYQEGLSDLLIPAPLSAQQTRCVQDLARRAFQAVDAAGLARVDFFIERESGHVYVNEINTMPGFTSTSMYPKLWEATGVSYPELVERLIQLALDRHNEDQRFSTRR